MGSQFLSLLGAGELMVLVAQRATKMQFKLLNRRALGG
jgi:hypothetical protein